ncbi:doublecortin domain-containing protein 2B [Seriola lalandi dorsalis]|uniref:doublecortin domain-containing protein 2B n=1 Tax=Seriola lalandi dorsalis TaxID=1841481 RepID=UPI000C6F469C|nr:doublecortin domain-containing protein 2B [Seriola lalandi dorsalis]
MAASTAATTVLPPVKSVMVYRNGDPFYNGRRFVVNQRQVATMEAFLNEVTQNIGAPLAVRTLYTPRQGHRVADLQDLQTGAQYVAAGYERFKKLDYLNVGAKKQPAAHKETQAKVTQRPNVSAKWRKFIPVPCIIHVFRNGDLLCPPFRFIIPRSMQQDLEQILSLVTEKVSLRTGAVRRLCSLEGATVSSAGELETGHCYVAVGTERFKKLPYVELLVSKATERYYPGKRRLLRRTENGKAGSGPEDQYSDSALLDSPERVAEVVEDEELNNTNDPPHSTKQRDAQIIKIEQHNEREHPHKYNGKQAQSSEQNGVEQTKDSARAEKSAAEILEPELKHTTSTSRPSSSSSQGKNRGEKDSPQDVLSNTAEQNHHQDDL